MVASGQRSVTRSTNAVPNEPVPPVSSTTAPDRSSMFQASFSWSPTLQAESARAPTATSGSGQPKQHVARNEIVVPALIDYPSAVEHDDAVAAADCRESMGHHDDGALPPEPLQGSHEGSLGDV